MLENQVLRIEILQQKGVRRDGLPLTPFANHREPITISPTGSNTAAFDFQLNLIELLFAIEGLEGWPSRPPGQAAP
jgi:hypothetical protein